MSTLADRQKLWKLHHARADFSMVSDTCRHVLEQKVDFDDPIYYALVVGIYTVYGRPFTRSTGAGKIEESIVPEKHRPLHNQLLTHRHKVYAHSDATGAPASFGNINQVRFFVRADVIHPGVTRWRSEPEVLQEIIVLCEVLKEKTKYWIDKLQDKYFPHVKVPIGEYVIDLNPSSTKFFTRVVPLDQFQ
jgi:hypothetical protein